MRNGSNDSECLADYRQATYMPATASAKQWFSFPRSFRMAVQLLWPCSIAPGWFRLSEDISKVRYSIEQFAEADLLAVMLFAYEWSMIRLNGFRWGKKICQLPQAA